MCKGWADLCMIPILIHMLPTQTPFIIFLMKHNHAFWNQHTLIEFAQSSAIFCTSSDLSRLPLISLCKFYTEKKIFTNVSHGESTFHIPLFISMNSKPLDFIRHIKICRPSKNRCNSWWPNGDDALRPLLLPYLHVSPNEYVEVFLACFCFFTIFYWNIIVFYWKIVTLQCCVSFWCTTWVSHIFIHISLPSWAFLPPFSIPVL